MSGSATAREVLIGNEQTKLLANALDRASTALGAGSILPLVNLWRSAFSSGSSIFPAWLLAASAGAFFLIAIVLHFTATRVFGDLR